MNVEEPRIHFVPVNVGANGYRSDAGPSGPNRSMAPSSSGSISAAPPPVAMNATSAPPPPIVQMPVPDPAEPPPPDAILDRPQTTALLTTSFSQDLPQKSKGILRKSKGLLRSLSSKKKEEPRVHFVPVNVGANGYRSDAGPSGLNWSMTPASSGSISAAPPPVIMNTASTPSPPIVQMPILDPAEPPPPVIPEPVPMSHRPSYESPLITNTETFATTPSIASCTATRRTTQPCIYSKP